MRQILTEGATVQNLFRIFNNTSLLSARIGWMLGLLNHIIADDDIIVY